MNETPLSASHRAAGARLVSFAGWRLPLQFTSVAEEARGCREAAALFDVSHMGVLILHGPEARAAARRVLTKDVTAVPAGCGVYALLCHDGGGILDDLIALVESDDAVWLVANAANRAKDAAWIREHLSDTQTELEEWTDHFIIALQGPRAEEILREVTEGEPPPYAMTCAWQHFRGASGLQFRDTAGARGAVPLLVSRTGYTGEDGFELFGHAAHALAVWEALVRAGRPRGLVPAGLAARDVLRQEMGFPLWGQDLEETTTPLEAGLRWAIDWSGSFLGKEALEHAIPARQRGGFRVIAPGVARAGAAIFRGDERIGQVTSGTYSHNLGAAIGQGYVCRDAKASAGDEVRVEVRGRRMPAVLAKLPFLPARTKPSWARVRG